VVVWLAGGIGELLSSTRQTVRLILHMRRLSYSAFALCIGGVLDKDDILLEISSFRLSL